MNLASLKWIEGHTFYVIQGHSHILFFLSEASDTARVVSYVVTVNDVKTEEWRIFVILYYLFIYQFYSNLMQILVHIY